MSEELIETPATTEAPSEKPAETPAAKPADKAAPQQERREARPPRGENRGGDRGPRQGGGDRGSDRGGDRGGDRGPRGGGDRGPRGEGRPGGHGGGYGGDRGGFRPDQMADIDIDKLINDSLYLDNQAHAVVARLRDMDSGTKSQLRRFYNAVRRACRAPEGERQHEFVMLRARLAYTIARHGLRSLDVLERLLLQVTRKNDQKGYERFRDLFEALVAYNE
jgi:CRISPR type III-A-associated protein Csm2